MTEKHRKSYYDDASPNQLPGFPRIAFNLCDNGFFVNSLIPESDQSTDSPKKYYCDILNKILLCQYHDKFPKKIVENRYA